MKFNNSTLQKFEKIFQLSGYKVRYEKGNFKSGSCVVWDRKMIIIPKFYPTPEKIKVLMELIREGQIELAPLEDELQALVTASKQTEIFS